MLKCAVIGVGNMGKHHARIYDQLESSKLVAVSDIENRSGEKIASQYNCKFYCDYKEMILNEDIDAVSIAVPTLKHAEVSLYCIEKALHILIEKPIASSINEAQNIISAGQKSNVIVQVGHIEHFNPAVLKLKTLVSQRFYGELISIMGRRVGICSPQDGNSNIIIDLAIHDIELCNYLTEKIPKNVFCRAGNVILPDREDYADIFLEYEGVNVLLQCNWITPVKIRKMHLTFTRGYADLDFIKQKLYIAERKFNNDFDDYSSFLRKYGESKMVEIPVKNEEPLKLEIEYFLECIKNKVQPIIDGNRALDALGVALEALNVNRDGNVNSVSQNKLQRNVFSNVVAPSQSN